MLPKMFDGGNHFGSVLDVTFSADPDGSAAGNKKAERFRFQRTSCVIADDQGEEKFELRKLCGISS